MGTLSDSTPSSPFSGEIEITGVSGRGWTPEEVAIWSRDPFGPIRMADEVGVVIGLPAAGGFVPYPNPRYVMTGGMQPMQGGV